MQFSRRLIAASILLLAFCGQPFAAGSIQLSLSQQFDSQGRPLSGGLLNFFVAGTTTPQNAFQDTALTIPYPNPIVLDASGRVPPFYLADGLIKIRLSTSAGVTVLAADNLLVVGASSGGGGGGSIDATTILATGDVKARYGTGTLTGFVRMNGRTIGSATSGATERANADAQTLFEYLWNNDPNLTVSSGRGATSIADWTANKTIALPDLRGRAIAGMDDMGAAAASRLTSTFFATATTLGIAGGSQSIGLAQANLPAYNFSTAGLAISTPSISITDPAHSHANALTDPGHFHGFTADITNVAVQSGAGGSGAANSAATNTGTSATGMGIVNVASFTGITASSSTPALTGTIGTGGSGTAHSLVAPTMVMTFYIKL